MGKRCFSKMSKRVLGPHPSYSVGTGDSFLGVKSANVLKLTAYLHLVLRLRMSGVVPLLLRYACMKWSGGASYTLICVNHYVLMCDPCDIFTKHATCIMSLKVASSSYSCFHDIMTKTLQNWQPLMCQFRVAPGNFVCCKFHVRGYTLHTVTTDTFDFPNTANCSKCGYIN
jgi:hypothetical protein